MGRRVRWGALLVVAGMCTPASAFAHAAGMNAYSGMNAANTCNNCHNGGTAPTVAFAGPASLTPGQTATYTFTVTTGQPKTGVDIAATAGVTLTPMTNLAKSMNDLTHPAGGVATAAGATQYTFQITAPAAAGNIQLWGAGNAVNGDAMSSGDRGAATTMMVTIAAPPTGGIDAGASGGTDAGSGTSPSGSVDDDGGIGDPGTDETVYGGDGGPRYNRDQDPAMMAMNGNGGCAVRRTGAPGFDFDGLAAFAAFAVGTLLTRSLRRRRRS